MKRVIFFSLFLLGWAVCVGAAERSIPVDKAYLVFPISNDAGETTVTITCDKILEHRFQITFADSVEQADWFAFLDVREYAGKTLVLSAEKLPEGIRCMDEVPRKEPLYGESVRPQLRFSQQQGWNNDPNGLCFCKGKYHFFWQSNPFGRKWDNMYWGHAVSEDLVHWTELGLTLRPHGGDTPKEQRNISMANGKCFSGSGMAVGDALAFCFTDTDRGECSAFSMDGKTLEYGTLLIPHKGRDPKMFKYEGQLFWAVYDEEKEKNISFYTSRKNGCEKTGEIAGFHECPEIFQLPVEGTGETKWVLFGADARYMVGQFNGQTFVPDHEGKHRLHYGNFYASQCFNNLPNGRVVQIGWAQMNLPNTVFNQGFSLPLELTLKSTPNGVRLFANPVAELETLRTATQTLRAGEPLVLAGFGDGQLYDVTVRFPANADAVLRFGENAVHYNAEKKMLEDIPVAPEADGGITVRVVIDRPMYEIVVNHGAAYRTQPRRDMGKKFEKIMLEGSGSGTIHAMKSIW
ncbi:MAG: glycoside hydrolase family 32 protein [Planctomycetia bacterium]|nr:glycoside hydrolase family 32 protein [Planctomycetia bacterium]